MPRVMKTRKLRNAGHVTWERRQICTKFLVVKPERKREI
jgi:hypothetical protein